MRFNSLGNVVSGVGSGTIGVDGAEPAALSGILGGDPNWLNDDEFIFANASAGTLHKYNVATSTLTLVDSAHANDLGAGADKWAAYLTTSPDPSKVGLRSNLSGAAAHLPLASLGDMSEDGILAAIQNAAQNTGLRAYNASGSLLFSRSATYRAGTGIRCRENMIAFCEDTGTWVLLNATTGQAVPFAARVDTIDAIHPLLSGSIPILIETDQATGQNRVTVRSAAAAKGYLIAFGVPTWWLDAVVLSNGLLLVGWSINAGELPTEINLLELNLKNGANRSASTSSGAIVWTTNPPLQMINLPATQVSLAGLYEVNKHPVVDPQRIITEPWQRFLDKLQAAATGPIAASRITGVVPPANGGTGGGGGLTAIDAANLYGTAPQAVKWTEKTITTTGVQGALDFFDADLLRCANIAALTIAGLVIGVPAERLAILAIGPADVVLAHQSGSATAPENRIITADGNDLTLEPGEFAFLSRDGTTARWRVMALGGSGAAITYYMSPLVTGGDPTTSELVFAPNGDVVMVPIYF